jgi:hypothetical protein
MPRECLAIYELINTYSRDVSVVMGKPSDDDLDEAKRLMGALVQMKPKPHDEMEVGKTTVKKKTSPVRRLPSIPLRAIAVRSPSVT